MPKIREREEKIVRQGQNRTVSEAPHAQCKLWTSVAGKGEGGPGLARGGRGVAGGTEVAGAMALPPARLARNDLIPKYTTPWDPGFSSEHFR